MLDIFLPHAGERCWRKVQAAHASDASKTSSNCGSPTATAVPSAGARAVTIACVFGSPGRFRESKKRGHKLATSRTFKHAVREPAKEANRRGVIVELTVRKTQNFDASRSFGLAEDPPQFGKRLRSLTAAQPPTGAAPRARLQPPPAPAAAPPARAGGSSLPGAPAAARALASPRRGAMAQQILHATFNQDATCVRYAPLRCCTPAARADVSVARTAPPLAAPQLPGGRHARRLPHLQHRGACAVSRARAAEPRSQAAVLQRAAVALFASALPSRAAARADGRVLLRGARRRHQARPCAHAPPFRRSVALARLTLAEVYLDTGQLDALASRARSAPRASQSRSGDAAARAQLCARPQPQRPPNPKRTASLCAKLTHASPLQPG